MDGLTPHDRCASFKMSSPRCKVARADDDTVQRYALITFGLLANLNVNVMSTADDYSKEKSGFFCLFILNHQKRKRSQRSVCAIYLEGLQIMLVMVPSLTMANI